MERWIHGFITSFVFRELDLLKPIYKETARNGHFGKNKFAWEKSKELKIPEALQEKIRVAKMANGDIKRSSINGV